MSDTQAMAVAEKLLGTIRTHTAYACPDDAPRAPASGQSRGLIQHLKGIQYAVLQQLAGWRGQRITLGSDGLSEVVELPKSAAPLIAAIDGRRSLNQIAAATGVDPFAFGAAWDKVEAKLAPWGMLLYSSVLR